MNKKILMWLLAFLASNYAFGQYSVSSIADSLKEDANVDFEEKEVL